MNDIYSAGVIASLELGWGEGWLSPGGEQELDEILDGIDIEGKTILDIGVGAGGPALMLLARYGAAHVTGVDVEQTVLDRAAELADQQQLRQRLDLYRVDSEYLPFENDSFDIVFSKDCFVHVSDIQTLFNEAHRVLRADGIFVFSDWCCSPAPYSQEMKSFLDNGMGFSMATAGSNLDCLIQAGFTQLTVRDRNRWFTEFASQEYDAAIACNRARMVDRFGAEKADSIAAAAGRRKTIGEQGHLRPAHFITRKAATTANPLERS